MKHVELYGFNSSFTIFINIDKLSKLLTETLMSFLDIILFNIKSLQAFSLKFSGITLTFLFGVR